MRTWPRDLVVASLTAIIVGILVLTIGKLFHLSRAQLRPEVWILASSALSGVLVGRRLGSVWAAVIGIMAPPAVVLAVGFAWISRRFPEARLSANVIGVLYIAAVAAIGGGVGVWLARLRSPAERRVAPPDEKGL